MRTGFEIGFHLNQQDLPLHRGIWVKLDNLQDIYELIKLLGDLFKWRTLNIDHDSHP